MAGHLKWAILISVQVLCSMMLGSVALPVVEPQLQDQYFEHVGSTSTGKEYYLSLANYTLDFGDAYGYCKYAHGMDLAIVQTDEELTLLDEYYGTTQGNSSDQAWTSYLEKGAMKATWATDGSEYEGPELDFPWPSDGGGTPIWSWYFCATVRKVCVRPPGAPEGCFPTHTRLLYSDCRAQKRFLCQKTHTK